MLVLALCFGFKGLHSVLGLKSWLLLLPSLWVLAWLSHLTMELPPPLPLSEVELDVVKPTSTELDSS